MKVKWMKTIENITKFFIWIELYEYVCISVHRHHKSLQFGYVTVYPDYALLPVHLSIPPNLSPTAELLPTFCVEIKPKQGWVPAPDRRLPKCTFCLNQYLKVRNIYLNIYKISQVRRYFRMWLENCHGRVHFYITCVLNIHICQGLKGAY
jgi:hypothetical protein